MLRPSSRSQEGAGTSLTGDLSGSCAAAARTEPLQRILGVGFPLPTWLQLLSLLRLPALQFLLLCLPRVLFSFSEFF